jgi:hypothetical protein
MKSQVVIFFFITLTLFFSSCINTGEINNYKSAKSVNYEYFKQITSLEIVQLLKFQEILI